VPYAFIQDVPANPQIYGRIRAELGETPPPGLISHVVVVREGGLRYIDVWETEAAWDRFRDERVEPAVEAVLAGFGIPHDHSAVVIEPIEVIHVWTGHAPARA
jgi:hypothetical protein